jgi:uncharacterized membrane protein YdbT with pleckstrin-like domain
MSETNSWSTSPSQTLNIGAFIRKTFVFSLIFAGGYFLQYKEILSPYIPVEYDTKMGFGAFYITLICFSIISMMWSWLSVSCTEYSLTSERLIIKKGVLNITVDEAELYRVKDYKLDKPLILRIFGQSNIILNTSDVSNPVLILEGIDKGEVVIRKIRESVEEQRRIKGVREIDM